MVDDSILISVFSLLWFIIGFVVGRISKAMTIVDTILRRKSAVPGDSEAGRSEATDEQH